jgi:uncharacterized repeat protein (TIGR01451 family)
MKVLTGQYHRHVFVVVLLIGEQLLGIPAVLAQTVAGAPIANTATASYAAPLNPGAALRAISETVTLNVAGGILDPNGLIAGCAGERLSRYQGFNVGLYDVDSSGLEPTRLTSLTPTEIPDIAGNGVPAGLLPNGQNVNPYFLGSDGRYNFLFDDARGQLQVGRSYILVVAPPSGSPYAARRFKLVITARNGNVLSYRATALDGKAISTTDGATSLESTLTVTDAGVTGLVLAVFNLSVSVCDAQDIQITKSGDRASAQPGDIAIYRLSVRNLSSTTLSQLTAIDTLPLGFQLIANSVRAELAGSPVPITTRLSGATVTFQATANLPPSRGNGNAVLNIAYAVRLTPDAVRGTGRNSALIAGQRADNRRTVRDGPAIHRLRVSSGLLSDCGTIIGRVFVDQNFDGEQQPNEPGVPNAVVFLDDGNRITTDPNGLFSVANVLPGQRTGVLDLTSLSGYTLAPNLYFSERNSQSRLVNLAPGGLVRMNFAVTPASREVQK